jgi:hypothetical protein
MMTKLGPCVETSKGCQHIVNGSLMTSVEIYKNKDIYNTLSLYDKTHICQNVLDNEDDDLDEELSSKEYDILLDQSYTVVNKTLEILIEMYSNVPLSNKVDISEEIQEFFLSFDKSENSVFTILSNGTNITYKTTIELIEKHINENENSGELLVDLVSLLDMSYDQDNESYLQDVLLVVNKHM